MCKHTPDFGRTENTRTILPLNKISQTKSEQTIIDEFNKNINSIKERLELYRKLAKDNVLIATDDMFRLEIVMLISAVDYYIHEIVKEGIIQIFNNEREETKGYNSFVISLQCVKKALKNPESVDWLKEEISFRNKIVSFQKFDKIKNAIAIITNNSKNIFRNIAKKMNKDNEGLEKELNKIIDRRNNIAHQCDIQSGAKKRTSINYGEVKKNVLLLDKFVNYLHEEII